VNGANSLRSWISAFYLRQNTARAGRRPAAKQGDAMTLFGQTLVLYLVIGAGVATAVYLAEGAGTRWFRVVTAVPFWPLYLPLLLAQGRPSAATGELMAIQPNPDDELATAIKQVDAELEAALGSLDGWAEHVLAREKSRIRDLRTAWLAQAQRIREMDRVLALPEYAQERLEQPRSSEGTKLEDRVRNSQQARRQNVERLQGLRRRAFDDLAGSLAWVRELVSMIHLAKFSGAPAARAEELVAQIAAAVEGLSELTWQEEPNAA
jgi:hypothetical protein